MPEVEVFYLDAKRAYPTGWYWSDDGRKTTWYCGRVKTEAAAIKAAKRQQKQSAK